VLIDRHGYLAAQARQFGEFGRHRVLEALALTFGGERQVGGQQPQHPTHLLVLALVGKVKAVVRLPLELTNNSTHHSTSIWLEDWWAFGWPSIVQRRRASDSSAVCGFDPSWRLRLRGRPAVAAPPGAWLHDAAPGMGLARGSQGAYLIAMRAMWSKALAVSVVAVLAVGAMGDADARQKKQRTKRSATPALQYDSSGTPSIMRDGDRGISIMREENAPKPKGGSKEAVGPRKIPRGSSTYIAPPVPSPNTGRATVTPATPGVYKPPPITTFGDRATDAIHSYPLEKGIGNNPTDLQSYIRQRAN
jgi:hypothetical protein